MYILSNAMKNLVRNKGRNIIIAAIMLAIIVSTVVTLTINNATAKVIDEIRLDLGSRVEIQQDFMEMKQSGLGKDDASYVSIDDFIEYSKSEYLSNTIFNANMYAWSDTFRAVDEYGDNPGETTRVNDTGETVLVETCKLVGTSNLNALADFGTDRMIVEGEVFSAINDCIISEELADLNNLSLGDSISLSGSFATDKAYTLTITGIYSDKTEEYINMMLAMNGLFANNRRNEIITSFDTLMSVGWESNAGLEMKGEYFLKNPDDITAFEAEVRAKGLPVTYNVSINQAAFDKVAGPLSNMEKATMTFMIVILVLGVIVLALISFIAVRERKYEVGVLRAMGMEKSKIGFGLISEAIMIATLCLIIGLSAGSVMAQPIADSILDRNVAAVQEDETANGGGNKVLFASGQMQTDDAAAGFVPESEIQVHLSMEVIIKIIILTLGLAMMSGIIGVSIITQYEPLKILRERN